MCRSTVGIGSSVRTSPGEARPGCKNGGGGSRSLLDGTGMMILMASERGPAGKGFLTVGERAFVGPLSGMDPAMPG